MTQAFNLSQFANKVNSSGLADLTTAVTGTLPVANGGTNQTTYTNGQLLIGNTTGNTLTKATITAGTGITVTNGSGAITIAASGGGQFQTELFTAPGTWTKPASATQVRVTVIGGGGGGFTVPGGGYGGLAAAIVPVSAPVAITVGTGGSGNPGSAPGGTSSFGSAVSSTGGGPGGPTAGASGTGTVSTGTALKSGVNITHTGNTFSFISGITVRPAGTPGPGLAYSVSSTFMAGAAGQGSAPGAGSGGVGGAILVEFVG